MWRPGGKRPGRGRAAREVGPFPSATTKSLVLGVGRGAPALSPTSRAKTHLPGPSTHLPAVSCISCKHQHVLWGEGLAVLGGGGATPGGQQAQHTMAGPGLRLAPPTARASSVTQKNATLGESWMVRRSPGAGGARQVCRATRGPPAPAPSTLTAACSVLEVKAPGRGTHSESSLPGVSKHLVLHCLPDRQPPPPQFSHL